MKYHIPICMYCNTEKVNLYTRRLSSWMICLCICLCLCVCLCHCHHDGLSAWIVCVMSFRNMYGYVSLWCELATIYYDKQDLWKKKKYFCNTLPLRILSQKKSNFNNLLKDSKNQTLRTLSQKKNKTLRTFSRKE